MAICIMASEDGTVTDIVPGGSLKAEEVHDDTKTKVQADSKRYPYGPVAFLLGATVGQG